MKELQSVLITRPL